MIPPDYTDVSQESPREAIANSAMTLRELARQLRDGGLVNRSLELIGVASRLERACQQLDAERRGREATTGSSAHLIRADSAGAVPPAEHQEGK